MGKVEDLNWNSFGFPEPGFLPAWKPATGLEKALAERRMPLSGQWDREAIANSDPLKMFSATGTGRQYCRDFDSRLETVAVKYLNQTKIANPSDWSNWSDIFWRFDELLSAAADGGRVADPRKGDLSPEWNLEWLLQRKRAIDLLLFAPVPYKYDFVSGSTHTGEPSTPAESVAAALAGTVPGTGSGLPSTYINYIYGPDHGWREGSYCCNVAITRKIYAELSGGFAPDGEVRMIIRIAGADGSDASFSSGGTLGIGLNVLTADANGLFIEFAEADFGHVATPVRDRETRGGWCATACGAFADYTTIFRFRGDQ